MSDTENRGHQTVTDEDIIIAVRLATRDGDTQLNGEPGYDDIVYWLPITKSWLSERMQDLVERGQIERSSTTVPGEGAVVATFSEPEDDAGRTEVWAR